MIDRTQALELGADSVLSAHDQAAHAGAMSTVNAHHNVKAQEDNRLRAENGNATWCTITRVVLVGTPVGCLLAYNSG